MSGPLDGFRIVDLTTMISGPLATMILGDQGADVIKVEAPPLGDQLRYFGTTRGGLAAIFTTGNRSKRSLVLNLREPAGVAALERLVADADVFVQNFRPGAVDRMGIGEAALRRVKPDLVYVSISGFGDAGPYSGKRVYDPIVQALSGMASIQADPADGRPSMVRTIVPDKLTAVAAAQAITAALLRRQRDGGRGEHVRLAMLDVVVSWLWPDAMANHTYLGDGVTVTPPISILNLVFETADGHLAAGAVSDADWESLARGAGRPEWIDDPRFKTLPDRTRNLDALLETLNDAFRARPTAEWIERLDAAQAPCARINTREEVLADPQVAQNELIVETRHPHAGRMREPRPAARFERAPLQPSRPAPALGEHTDEILAEAGYAEAEIRELRGRGVVA